MALFDMPPKARPNANEAFQNRQMNFESTPDLNLRKRQSSNSRSPCPATGGTVANTNQSFNLVCGFDLVGDDLYNLPATSLGQCIDVCSGWQPRCTAVAYEVAATLRPENCYLKQGLGTKTAQTTFQADGAVAVWPSTQRDCNGNNNTATAAGYSWQTYCGFDYPRDDISKTFSASLHDCLGICAEDSRCLSVSYDAAMSQGYRNCFLKSTSATGGLFKQTWVTDSAFRTGPAPASSSSPSNGSANSASQSSASSSQDSSTSHSSSKGWIAGAVIGALLLVALVAGLVFFLIRRNRSGASSANTHGYVKEEEEVVASTPSELSGEPATMRRTTNELGGRPVDRNEAFR